MSRKEKTIAACILIVEDNPPNLELMFDLLEAFGYAPLTACDGEAAIAIALKHRPDLVICDIHLPKLDGYGVVRKLKSNSDLRNVPVIAVTALAMVGDRDKMLASGFDGYISKPIVPETFVQQAEAFLPVELRSGKVPVSADLTAADEEVTSAQNGATILVIDDTPANLDFARTTLEPSGYRVITVSGVIDALALTDAERPDLVLCDLHMLPKDGRDFLKLAQRHSVFLNTPMITISSTFPTEQERIECLEAGAIRFIGRPIEPQVLLAEIAALLNKNEGVEQ